MKNIKIFKSTPTKVIFTLIISLVLIFLLYETIHLEKKIEKNMFDISTSDVLSITENNADFIKGLFKRSDNYIADMKNNVQLQNQIENKLKLLITDNIKYAYVLYKDEKGTFRFLADASNPDEKAFLNQKFDVDSQIWFDIYETKKPQIIRHELLKTLSISFIVPILNKDSVELLLVIDFSLEKVKNINDVITLMQNGIMTILIIFILFLLILVFQMINYQKVEKSAYTDQLTNVHNRNYLEAHQDEIELEHYILAVLDIDLFKKVNDTHGHNIGDIVLKETAKIISNTIRVSNDDMIIRFGGEEFILFIKKVEGNEKGAFNVLGRILTNIEKHKFEISKTEHINITVSIGVNLTPDKSNNFTEAFKVADTALYTAKESGRNNIKVSS